MFACLSLTKTRLSTTERRTGPLAQIQRVQSEVAFWMVVMERFSIFKKALMREKWRVATIGGPVRGPGRATGPVHDDGSAHLEELFQDRVAANVGGLEFEERPVHGAEFRLGENDSAAFRSRTLS